MQEHGSFNMNITDQIIIINAYGAWNLETALRWGREFKLLANQIESSPWACIVDLSSFELAIPEVWEHIDEINDWCNLHNQKYEVVICSLSIQKSLLENSHKKLTNVETNFCSSLKQSIEWLSKFGVIKI